MKRARQTFHNYSCIVIVAIVQCILNIDIIFNYNDIYDNNNVANVIDINNDNDKFIDKYVVNISHEINML